MQSMLFQSGIFTTAPKITVETNVTIIIGLPHIGQRSNHRLSDITANCIVEAILHQFYVLFSTKWNYIKCLFVFGPTQ